MPFKTFLSDFFFYICVDKFDVDDSYVCLNGFKRAISSLETRVDETRGSFYEKLGAERCRHHSMSLYFEPDQDTRGRRPKQVCSLLRLSESESVL